MKTYSLKPFENVVCKISAFCSGFSVLLRFPVLGDIRGPADLPSHDHLRGGTIWSHLLRGVSQEVSRHLI